MNEGSAERAERAYVTGLRLLARRELSEAQLRDRLARRRFEPDDIDDAVARLRRERAVDDLRAALACARTEAGLHQRGRTRVARRLEAMGIARDVARQAVGEVFAEIDEADLLARALDRRLRRQPRLDDPAVARRLHRFLVAQGFDPARVTALLRQRMREYRAAATTNDQRAETP